jgi:hypothetical protein
MEGKRGMPEKKGPKAGVRRAGELDSESVQVDFAPELRAALGDLAAATRGSAQLAEMHATIQEWAIGHKPSVFDVIFSLPFIADGVHEHIRVNNDTRAQEAWDNFQAQLGNLEDRAFKLKDGRERTR